MNSKRGKAFGKRLGRVVAPLVEKSPVRSFVRNSGFGNALGREVYKRWETPEIFRVKVADNSFEYSSVPGDPIARYLYWEGINALEPETMPLFLKLAERCRYFVDIGAYSGAYTLAACTVNGNLSADAFEPVPDSFRRIQGMVERNGLQSRVRLSMKAVSEISQPRSFHVPELERKRPTASLIDSEMSDLAVRSIEVECVSLDETIRHDLSPLVFKIDVEGAEHLALAGMRKTLRDRHPIVIMECLPGARVAEIERELTPLSYAIWHLTPEGPERREGIIPDQTKRANNWLFVPPSHEKLVGDIFADMGSSSD